MFKETLRVFAVILMIVIIIMGDFPFYDKMRDPSTQLFLGILVICTIYYDTVLGFIMGLVLMLIYYEIYKKVKILKSQDKIVGVESGKKIEHYTKLDEETYPRAPPASKSPPGSNPDTPTMPVVATKNGVMQLNYISEEHLLAAQNNIFDAKNYSSEVKGMEKGYNNEPVYGAQGLDSDNVNVHGYDEEDRFSNF